MCVATFRLGCHGSRTENLNWQREDMCVATHIFTRQFFSPHISQLATRGYVRCHLPTYWAMVGAFVISIGNERICALPRNHSIVEVVDKRFESQLATRGYVRCHIFITYAIYVTFGISIGNERTCALPLGSYQRHEGISWEERSEKK